MSDKPDNLREVPLHEVHRRCSAVVEMLTVEILELQTDQGKPDGYVIVLDAKHHRARKGKIRLGVTLDREALEDFQRLAETALDHECQ